MSIRKSLGTLITQVNNAIKAGAPGSITYSKHNDLLNIDLLPGLMNILNGSVVGDSAYESIPEPGIAVHQNDIMFILDFVTANTGPSTIAFNGLTPVALKRRKFDGSIIELRAGDIQPGRYSVYFDGVDYLIILPVDFPLGGGLFIVNVVPQGAGTVTNTDVVKVGKTIVGSTASDTDDIRVTVEWDGSNEDWNGTVTVNGQAAIAPARIGVESRRFTADYDISLSITGTIEAVHSNALKTIIPFIRAAGGPEIQTVQFSSPYQPGQTELKQGDTVTITGTIDTNAVEIEIADFEACESSLEAIPSGMAFSITGTIADRGLITDFYVVRVRAKNAFGTFGAYLNSNTGGGNVDGVDRVQLNNTYPSIVIDSITYPVSQSALKGSETALVNTTISDTDTILYDDPTTTELTISNPTVEELSKLVTRLGGTYNVTINNFRIVGTRAANLAVTTVQAVVFIVNVPAQVGFSPPAARLRSGGNVGTVIQPHLLTIASDQLLNQLPVISVPPTGGTLVGSMAGLLNQLIFTQTLNVHDDDSRGTHSVTLVQATGLSGMVTVAFSNSPDYFIGGFVIRDVFFSPFANEEGLGVNVVDTAKLVALDKDLIAMTYSVNFDDVTREYTITQPTGVLNSTGNILHWNDVTEVNNNTTGSSFIRIEETL